MRASALLLVALHSAGCAQAEPVPPEGAPVALRMALDQRPGVLVVTLALTNTSPGPVAVCAGVGESAFRVALDADTLVLRCGVIKPPPGWEAAETELPRLRRLDAGQSWQELWRVPLPVRLGVPAPPDVAVPATVQRVRASVGVYPAAVIEASRALPDGTLQAAAPGALGAGERLTEAVGVPAQALPLAR